jgi:hypothetical protein
VPIQIDKTIRYAIEKSVNHTIDAYLKSDQINLLTTEEQKQEKLRIALIRQLFMDMMEDSVQRDLLIFTTLAAKDIDIVVQKIKDLPATTPTPTTATAADAVVSSKETNQPANDLQITATLTPDAKRMLTRLVKSGQEPTPDEVINTAIQQYYTLACIELADDLLFYDVIMAMTTALDKIFDTNKKERLLDELGTREDAAKRSALKAASLIHLVEGSQETVNRIILQRKMANDKRQIIAEITNTETETKEEKEKPKTNEEEEKPKTTNKEVIDIE